MDSIGLDIDTNSLAVGVTKPFPSEVELNVKATL